MMVGETDRDRKREKMRVNWQFSLKPGHGRQIGAEIRRIIDRRDLMSAEDSLYLNVCEPERTNFVLTG